MSSADTYINYAREKNLSPVKAFWLIHKLSKLSVVYHKDSIHYTKLSLKHRPVYHVDNIWWI